MTYKQLLQLEKLLTIDIGIFEKLFDPNNTDMSKLLNEHRIIQQEVKDVIASYSNQDINALKVMERDGKKGYHNVLKDPKGKPWL